MTYFVPNSYDKYVFDEHGYVYSIKRNRFLKPHRDWVHLTVDGCRRIIKLSELITDTYLNPDKYRVYSKHNLKDEIHLYIIDWTVPIMYHTTVDDDSKDNVKKVLKEHKINNNRVFHITSNVPLKIKELL